MAADRLIDFKSLTGVIIKADRDFRDVGAPSSCIIFASARFLVNLHLVVQKVCHNCRTSVVLLYQHDNENLYVPSEAIMKRLYAEIRY